MKRIVLVLLCCSALFCGTASTFAASITYRLLWSGAQLGNSATAEGTITLDDTLLPNPGRAPGQNPFGTVFSDLVMTVSGASSGNGTFSSAGGDFIGWNWDSGDFGVGVLDLTREFVDQEIANGILWGTPFAGIGGGMNFSAAPGFGAPDAYDSLVIKTNEAQGDAMVLISMAPVPLPGGLGLFMLGCASLITAVKSRRNCLKTGQH